MEVAHPTTGADNYSAASPAVAFGDAVVVAASVAALKGGCSAPVGVVVAVAAADAVVAAGLVVVGDAANATVVVRTRVGWEAIPSLHLLQCFP